MPRYHKRGQAATAAVPKRERSRIAMLAAFALLIVLFGTVSTSLLDSDPQLLWVFSFFGAIMVMGSPRPAETIAAGVGLILCVLVWMSIETLIVPFTLVGLRAGPAFLLAMFFGMLGAFLVTVGVRELLVRVWI
jgi:hypothetical protein